MHRLNKIATRYLIPELAGSRLTPKLCSRVADAFVKKYGRYAGWAQTLLFIAELPSQKALLQSLTNETKEATKDVNHKTVGNGSDLYNKITSTLIFMYLFIDKTIFSLQ